MNKLNIGDYVLVLNNRRVSGFDSDICKIDKISKDGTKARGVANTFKNNLSNRDFPITYNFPIEIQDYKTMLIDYMKSKDIDYPVLITCDRHSCFNIVNGQPTEDDYDDIIHFHCPIYNFDYKAKYISDIPNGTQIDKVYRNANGFTSYFYFTKSISDMADFVINKFNLRTKFSLENSFLNWLKDFENDNDDIFAWKDYNRSYKQLEWAISNGLGTLDYDEWQATQRILKHELKWETAKEITKNLYEKEDLSIFDCE